MGALKGKDLIQEKAYVTIKAEGDYPLMRFTDVRNDQISTAQLWERFSLTNLNKELLTTLSLSELEFNNSKQTSFWLEDFKLHKQYHLLNPFVTNLS